MVKPNALGAAAMLVSISVHRWGNRKTQRHLADKTAQDQQAEAAMFRVTKRLIGKESIKTLSSAFSHFKAHHYENTLPWLDNGYRILPAANYLTYIEGARKLKQAAMDQVEHFLQAYPGFRDAAKHRLGTSFNEADYPSLATLRRKWGIEMDFIPLPDKADFRVDVPAKELSTIYNSIDDQVGRAMEKAQADLFQRLYEVIEFMRDKLKEFRVVKGGRKNGKDLVEKTFRDSAVNNIKELCELLPRLNFTNNPELAKLATDAMAKLGTQDPDALREDEKLRAKALKDADALLARMPGAPAAKAPAEAKPTTKKGNGKPAKKAAKPAKPAKPDADAAALMAPLDSISRAKANKPAKNEPKRTEADVEAAMNKAADFLG